MSSPALRGPAWVTARQHRRTLWAALALVLLALAAVTALRIWDARYPDTALENGGWNPDPDNQAFGLLQWLLRYLGMGLVLLPIAVAALVAGPMVAREYASGTYALSLTQSVSPAAWLRSKLLLTAAGASLTALAGMGVFALGWSRTGEAGYFLWAEPYVYVPTGVALFAYLLAALAIGALIGQLVRRTLPAMAATALVMGLLTLVLGAYRWSLMPVETVTGPAGPTLWAPGNGLVMDTGLLTSSGARFDESACWEQINSAPGIDTDPEAWGKAQARCFADHDVVSQYADYHPESHFWPTQLIESGILLALAALALYAAFRVLRARHP
ncbi:ABC transporter permease [Streptomyces termitum]|uniref:ABC transporter permease n=1 Tax=Streptomyces termitum TaxID=67368 RepID=UPI0033BA925D